MKTLTAITNQSTVTAVQNVQVLIEQLNEAVDKDPNAKVIKAITNNLVSCHDVDLELTITGYENYFNAIYTHAQNPDTKAIAQKLRDLFKLFQD